MSMSFEPTEGQGPGAETSTWQTIRRFGPGTVVAVVALLFILQNQDQADFEFLWLSFRTGLWVMLLASLLAGIVIGWGMTARRHRRQAKARQD